MSIIEKAAKRLGQEHKGIASPAHTEPMPQSVARTPIFEPKVRPELVTDNRLRSSPKQEINLIRLQDMGMVTPNGGRTQVSEEFRFIKRPLIKHALHNPGAGNHGNLIMVTSSLPGEGKTFCAINLAMSIAMEMDHTVLLVDADTARPSVLQTLGLQAEGGLMDVLLDGTLDIADIMIKTNVETLSVLPAGKNHKHATELLASQNMSSLLDQIARRYPDRIIIFDSPPLLLTSEARVLASQMGQIVVVVEAEKTTQNALKDALRKISSCPNVSLVYNKGRNFSDGENYSSYYG